MPAPKETYTYEEAKIAVKFLGIKTATEYFQRYAEDPKLSSKPHGYYKDEWVDWYDFTGRERPQFYSMEEVIQKLKPLKCKSKSEYLKLCETDPLLPKNPEAHFKRGFSGWRQLLSGDMRRIRKGHVFYTYNEAKKLVQKHGINSLREYGELAKQDEKLPSYPYGHYKEWVDWYVFLGKEKKVYDYFLAVSICEEEEFGSQAEYLRKVDKDDYPELPSRPNETFKKEWIDWNCYLSLPYESVPEARDAAVKLGLTLESDYRAYNKPKVLPEDPVKDYGLYDWDEFIKFRHYSFEEAIAYCQKHKIRDKKQYVDLARANKRLFWPPTKMQGYTSPKDLYYQPDEFEKLYDEIGSYGDFVFTARRYSTQGKNLFKKSYITRNFIKDYLHKLTQPEHPGAFLSTKHSPPPLEPFIEALAKSDRENNTLRLIKEFLDLCLTEYCSEVDSDSGDKRVMLGFRNPFSETTIELPHRQGPSETVKPILPFEYVLKARKFLVPDSAKQLSDLTNAIEVYECDWYEVPKRTIDASDVDCVYRSAERINEETNRKYTVYEMWSPVRSIAVFALLTVPLRGQQILWNDSGEADPYILCLEKGKLEWLSNNHALAGAFKKPQGFLKKLSDGGIGMHSTTNKTQQKDGGYDIPWMPEELAYWLVKLRQWQSKYNPISQPFAWTDMPIKFDLKRLQRRGYNGKQCFLFRDPKEALSINRQMPIKTTLFKVSIAAVLYKIQDDQIPLAHLTNDRFETPIKLSHYNSVYTPHSFRASLITAYIMDSDVAVPIVSKLVGHASVVMTIYYTKIAELETKRALDEAEQQALSKSPDRVQNIIYQQKLENLKSEFVDNQNGALLETMNGSWPKANISLFEFGFCPYSGSRCDDGGELIIASGSKYNPVPNGYLGRQNCIRCRHFISGPAFLGGLKTIIDEIALEASESSKQMYKYQDAVFNLERQQIQCEETGGVFTELSTLKRYRNLYQKEAQRFDELSVDLISASGIAKNAIELLNTRPSGVATDNHELVLFNQNYQIDADIEKVSLFQHLDTICKNAELYACANPNRAIPRRSQMIDLISRRNEVIASMFELDEQQQLLIGNQITKLLIENLGDWTKLNQVVDGERLLTDYIGKSQMARLKSDIETIVHNRKLPHYFQGLQNV